MSDFLTCIFCCQNQPVPVETDVTNKLATGGG